MPKKQSLALLMSGSPLGMGMESLNFTLMSGGVKKKLQMTNLINPDNFPFIKHAEKSVPGFADVEEPHGDEDGPRTLTPGSESKMDAYHVDQH